MTVVRGHAVTADLVGFDLARSDDGRLRLAGIDEAGRGCWAGPVSPRP